MDEDKFAQAFKIQALREQFIDQQRIKDEAMLHSMHQLAFGSPSAQPYYNKEVDNAALFMDNKLKISAFNVYTLCTDDSMYKFDDTSTISSSYAITEYFNVMYHDKLLTPGSKCNYAINDTKNVVKHLNIFGIPFENIAKHEGSFKIGKITWKWENLHKALI